jgi:CheY-like chemotaxis protein
MGKRILVAEDEDTLRSLYEEVLTQEGYVVLSAANAQDALRLVRDEHPDLVVLDIKMPGMDGMEALYKILDIRRDLPVVINTSYPEFEDNYLSWAADAYIQKSSDLTELKETIRRLLD